MFLKRERDELMQSAEKGRKRDTRETKTHNELGVMNNKIKDKIKRMSHSVLQELSAKLKQFINWT